MMHFNNCVVTLCDTNTGKTFREYEHTRDGDVSRSRIAIPFGTEYKFRIKTTDGRRRRVEFVVDGTSLGELIFSGPDDWLERFINSHERFKFVEKTNGAVQDPTSPDNGQIVVKVWTEQRPDIQIGTINLDRYKLPFNPPPTPWSPNWPNYPDQPFWTSAGTHPDVLKGMGPTCMYSSTDRSGPELTSSTISTSCLRSCNNVGEDQKGATVGGSHSNQQFGSTVWVGDDTYAEFRFFVHAPKAAQERKLEPKTVQKIEFCPGCGTKLMKDSKFCHECGSMIPVLV